MSQAFYVSVVRCVLVVALLAGAGGCARHTTTPVSSSEAGASGSAGTAPTGTARAATPSPGTPVALVRRTPRVPPDTPIPAQVELPIAAQVASVRDAQAQGKLERLSVNGRPSPWRAADYLRDPTAYLSVIEPCRIWQCAEPESADALTTPEGHTAVLVNLAPLASQALSVQTWPGYPATLTSYDRGAFQNGLTSITVQADAQGIATAVFTATAGTTDTVRILAASPVTAGQVQFRIHIPAPGSP